MADENKGNYQKKVVNYSGKQVVLFSLDGQIWSTRKEELKSIMERHATERASYGGQITGGPQSKIPTARPKATSIQAARLGKQVPKEGEAEEAAAPIKDAAAVGEGKKLPSKKAEASPKKRAVSQAAGKKHRAKKGSTEAAA